MSPENESIPGIFRKLDIDEVGFRTVRISDPHFIIRALATKSSASEVVYFTTSQSLTLEWRKGKDR